MIYYFKDYVLQRSLTNGLYLKWENNLLAAYYSADNDWYVYRSNTAEETAKAKEVLGDKTFNVFFKLVK